MQSPSRALFASFVKRYYINRIYYLLELALTAIRDLIYEGCQLCLEYVMYVLAGQGHV
jgi:hypothetical protein